MFGPGLKGISNFPIYSSPGMRCWLLSASPRLYLQAVSISGAIAWLFVRPNPKNNEAFIQRVERKEVKMMLKNV